MAEKPDEEDEEESDEGAPGPCELSSGVEQSGD